MPRFQFSITAPATITAQIQIEADTIEEAQEKALQPEVYEKAVFALDDGNPICDVYLPDEEDYEILDAATPSP